MSERGSALWDAGPLEPRGCRRCRRGRREAKRIFYRGDGASADLTGEQVLQLAKRPYVRAITPDVQVRPSSYEDGQIWLQSADLAPLEGSTTAPGPATPTVAIIDSGIDATRAADFGARVVASVNLDDGRYAYSW